MSDVGKLYQQALMRVIDDAHVRLHNANEYNDGSLYDEGFVAGVKSIVDMIEGIEYQLREMLSQATER